MLQLLVTISGVAPVLDEPIYLIRTGLLRKNDHWIPTQRTSSASYYNREQGKALKRSVVAIGILVLIVAVISVIQLIRTPPLPSITTTMASSQVIPGISPSLPWASQGASDIALVGVGSTGSHGQQGPIGLASVAKIISALVIIQDHPLSLGQSGPTLTVSPADVSTYQNMLAAQDSVMVVTSGETLSEYQALVALLVPSADNVAIMLAKWDAGSTAAFVAKMNTTALRLGMTRSHYSDPSGLESSTQGTAPDQLIAAQALLKNPVLSGIVSLPQATLPVAGVVFNVNALVGHDGITGVKTGSTPAGGNYVFSGTLTLPSIASIPAAISANPTVVGVVLGQQGYTPLPSALSAGQALLDAFRKVPEPVKVLSAGQVIGQISAPGQRNIPMVAKTTVTLIGWPTLSIHYTFEPKATLPSSFANGYQVGVEVVSIGSEIAKVSVIANGVVKAPGLGWKLRRL